MSETIVLIPTSRYVDGEMQLEVGRTPPALISICGKAFYELIAERAQHLGDKTKFILMTGEGKELFSSHLSRKHNDKFEIISVPILADLGMAIANAIDQIGTFSNKSLLINFGDTLVEGDLQSEKDVVFYADLKESLRWTTFTTDRNNRIDQIIDKNFVDSSDVSHVFTGVFLIQDTQAFRLALSTATTSGRLGLFYSALKIYLSNRDYEIRRVTEWMDVGHSDNYHLVRKRFVNKRCFNQIKIDETRAILEKRSSNTKKFLGEISWFLEMPSNLRCYLPQIFEHSLDAKSPYIKMEYYGYPTLGELFRMQGYSLGIWPHALDGCFQLLSEFKAHTLKLSATESSDALSEIYIEKTFARVASLSQHPLFGKFFIESFTINGQSHPPLNQTLREATKFIATDLISPQNFCLIHGDLCLANIIFDPRSRILKLIDPRGAFGRHTVYGDQRYDLAKLSHSFNGLYENIIEDCFSAVCEDLAITHDLKPTTYQSEVAKLFNQRLSKYCPNDLNAIALIEALLFITMVPLHEDFLHRQIVMFATGVQKLHAALGKISFVVKNEINSLT